MLPTESRGESSMRRSLAPNAPRGRAGRDASRDGATTTVDAVQRDARFARRGSGNSTELCSQ
jgi:hypothetical protein